MGSTQQIPAAKPDDSIKAMFESYKAEIDSKLSESAKENAELKAQLTQLQKPSYKQMKSFSNEMATDKIEALLNKTPTDTRFYMFGFGNSWSWPMFREEPRFDQQNRPLRARPELWLYFKKYRGPLSEIPLPDKPNRQKYQIGVLDLIDIPTISYSQKIVDEWSEKHDGAQLILPDRCYDVVGGKQVIKHHEGPFPVTDVLFHIYDAMHNLMCLNLAFPLPSGKIIPESIFIEFAKVEYKHIWESKKQLEEAKRKAASMSPSERKFGLFTKSETVAEAVA